MTINGAPLIDGFNRSISYLRLSVTDRCDLRCTYCMPERMTFLPKSEVLSLEELYDLACGFMDRGITKIRLTGGEPLVRRDVISLINRLGAHIGGELDELTLTTNGTQLDQYAAALFDAGIRRVNISLDTLQPDTFAALTRRDRLTDVLRGIDAAQQAGLKVKLNTVALKGVNEFELPDIISWAHNRDCEVTLIETMPLGTVDEERSDRFLRLDTVADRLRTMWHLEPLTRKTGGPARYFRVAETGGVLGLISPLTNNFCAGCNRIRVTATGQLYPCLGGTQQVDLRAAVRSDKPAMALNAALDQAMRIKPERHHFAIGDGPTKPALTRHMSMTGG